MVGDASGYPPVLLSTLLLPFTSYLLCLTPSPCTSAHLEPHECYWRFGRQLKEPWEGMIMSPPASVTVPQLPSPPNLRISHHPHPQPQKECHFLPPTQDSSHSCSKNMHPIPWSLHQACPLWNPELGLQEVLSVDQLNEWMRPCFWVWQGNHTKYTHISWPLGYSASKWQHVGTATALV